MWHLHLTLACRLTKNDSHARKNVQRLHQFFQTSLLTLWYLDHSFECLFPPTSSMFIFSLSYCEPVQLRRALAYLGLSCHLSNSPAPHQPGTTLVLVQDFQFYCAVASCGVLCRLSSRSKKLTLKYQWFNIQRLISQSQYLSKVWSFTVLKRHHPSCYIRGKELGELTPALQPGNASAPDMTRTHVACSPQARVSHEVRPNCEGVWEMQFFQREENKMAAACHTLCLHFVVRRRSNEDRY